MCFLNQRVFSQTIWGGGVELRQNAERAADPGGSPDSDNNQTDTLEYNISNRTIHKIDLMQKKTVQKTGLKFYMNVIYISKPRFRVQLNAQINAINKRRRNAVKRH